MQKRGRYVYSQCDSRGITAAAGRVSVRAGKQRCWKTRAIRVWKALSDESESSLDLLAACERVVLTNIE